MGSRIHSVDAMRIVAVALVVIIHTNPFEGVGATGNAVNFVLETVARVAVPFFFLASGYFFGLKTRDADPIAYFRARARSLTGLYVFGIVVALPPFLAGTAVEASVAGESPARSVGWRIVESLSPVDLLYYGTSVSEILWYVPALFVALALVAGFAAAGRPELALPVAVGFHVLALLGPEYAGIVDLPFDVRDGLFFGFFYVSAGHAIAARGWRGGSGRSGALLAATVAFGLFHVAERYAMGYVLGDASIATGVYAPSFTVGTAGFAVSLFLFLLSRPGLGASTPLPAWGSYAVGVYVVHPPVLAVLGQLADRIPVGGSPLAETVGWHLAFTPATFLGALGVYLAVHRLGVIEVGGSHFPRLPRRSRLSGRSRSE
ncbi:acyltransferase 3 [Halorubrum aidingense JCM 13560]|uniref:Acyltransferase 3 n=1 Tax=Halorubrum aidingense JCM 13560 TaxID=1230454 RepID=M0PLB8_9EURY|nr:acyltransferase [Halorubrum aidingense]EMA69510.1 acyltransferase 3 [Halorubrum aidingense JCM 13560]